MDIYGVPFALQTFDTNRLIVSDIPRFVVFNQPVEFTIDAANAGEGQLEVAINNGQIPNQVKSLGNSKFQFTFIPIINETHIIAIKFNGHDLAGKKKIFR
jgi:filamin